MERQIRLSALGITNCERIAFLLPKEGNDLHFMVITKGDVGFHDIIDMAEEAARRIERNERQKEAAAQKEQRRQMYLRLKEEFDVS